MPLCRLLLVPEVEVIQVAKRRKPHPGLTERHRLMTQLRQFSTMFGLDPASRAGLEVPDTIKTEKDTFPMQAGTAGHSFVRTVADFTLQAPGWATFNPHF